MKRTETDIEVVLLNGTTVDPLVTLEDGEDRYQIITDGNDYALCERIAPEHLPKGIKGNYTLATWWPKEVLKLLPATED